MARKKDPEGAKAQILDAALKLFSEKGFEATTMQNIVDLSGMSKGAIYYHFRDKMEIYEGLYESLSLTPYSCYAEIEKDGSLSAAEKLEKFLLTLIISPEKFLYDEAVREHKNPNLVEMTLRLAVLKGSRYVQAFIEEGIREGIYPKVDARMIAELFCLILDMWLDPSINEATTEEEFDRKIDMITSTFEMHGVPLITPCIKEKLKDRFRISSGFTDGPSPAEEQE